MNRYALLILLLLPLTTANAQRLTDPKQLVPELSTLTQPNAVSHMEFWFDENDSSTQQGPFRMVSPHPEDHAYIWPDMESPALLEGPVRSVTTIYEIPLVLQYEATQYVCGNRPYSLSNILYDKLQSSTTRYLFSKSGELKEISETSVMHREYETHYYTPTKRHAKNRSYTRPYIIFSYKKYSSDYRILEKKRVRKKMMEKNKKIDMVNLYGEKKWKYRHGHLVRYTNQNYSIPDNYSEKKHWNKRNKTTFHPFVYERDSLSLQYNADMLINYANKTTDDETASKYRFAYDSLGRLVYASGKKRYGKKQIYAYLYDSTGCVAWVHEEVGDSVGDMHILHYEPQPDGSLKVRITICKIASGGDKAEFAALYKNPDSCITPFFSKRFASCLETNSFSDYWKRHILFHTTGDYYFDSAGRMTGYCLRNQNGGIISRSVIRYDSIGRVVTMTALDGKLIFPHGSYDLPDNYYLLSSRCYDQLDFAYDDHGQLTEITEHTPLKYVVSIRYTYDERGNWIRRETWRDGRQTGAVSREIEYAE